MANVTQRIDYRVAAQDEASSVFAKVGHALEDLKHKTGTRGPLKEIFEIAKGGGAVAGITFGAVEIGNTAAEMSKLREEFDAGKISAAEYRQGMFESIPIFGRIVVAGHQINEFLTGYEAAQRRAAEETRLSTETMHQQREAIAHVSEALEDQERRRQRIKDAGALIGLTGATRELKSSELQQGEADTGARADAKSKVEKIKADSDAVFAKLKARRDALQGDLEGDSVVKAELASQKIRDIKNLEVAEQQRRDKAIDEINAGAQEEITANAQKGAAERSEIIKKELADAVKDGQAAIAFFQDFGVKFAAGAQATLKQQVKDQIDADAVLGDAKMNRLEAEAAAGDKTAELELKKLRIAQQINEEKQRLTDILNDQNLTEEQHKRAQEELDKLPARERALAAGREPTGPRLGTLETGRFVGDIATNRANSTRESLEQKMAVELAKQTQQGSQLFTVANKQVEAIKELAAAFRSNPKTSAVFQ